jgi:hypothetical protein
VPPRAYVICEVTDRVYIRLGLSICNENNRANFDSYLYSAEHEAQIELTSVPKIAYRTKTGIQQI